MKSSAGFTLAELVISIVLVGILVATSIPTFNNLTNRTQKQVNLSNMETIKNTFMQYYYVNHMRGNPHFPPEPENGLMDSTYREIILEVIYHIIKTIIHIIIIGMMIQVNMDL